MGFSAKTLLFNVIFYQILTLFKFSNVPLREKVQLQ